MNKFKEVFRLDLRSVGFARILIGFIGIFYFYEYYKEVDIFYSENAILSYRKLAEFTHEAANNAPFRDSRDINLFPIFKLSQTHFFVTSLTIFGMISSFLVMLGFRKNLFSLISWLLVTAFYDRFPIVTHGGDFMLRLSYLWMLILPSNDYYSLDSYFRENSKKEFHFNNAFSFFWIFQIFLLYELNTFYKFMDPKWYGEWSAMYYVGQANYVQSSLGFWLKDIPYKLSQIITILVLVLESYIPCLLFLPKKQEKIRIALIVSFIIFHCSIWTLINVSFVSQFCIAWWISLLPDLFWKSRIGNTVDQFLNERFTKLNAFFQKIYRWEFRPQHYEWFFIKPFAYLVFTLILLTSINTVTLYKIYGNNSFLSLTVRWFQLEQWWAMFTKNPELDYDGWYIGVTTLENGKEFDLFTNKPVTYDRPKDYFTIYKTYHFRKFLRDYSLSSNRTLDKYIGYYFCRDWNGANQIKMDSIKLIFMRETTPPHGSPPPIPKEEFRFEFFCNEKIRDMIDMRF